MDVTDRKNLGKTAGKEVCSIVLLCTFKKHWDKPTLDLKAFEK
jgi:hypothetical protein